MKLNEYYNKAFSLAGCKDSNPEHFGKCSLVRLLANLLAWLQPNHKYTAVQLRRGQGRLHFSFTFFRCLRFCFNRDGDAR